MEGYGGSDRLRLCERPDLRPAADEILVRVRAAGVNPVDWKIRRGDLRLILWLKFPYIPGGDIAGEVLEIGARVTRFKPGDRVVAFVDLTRGGGYAELAVVKETAAALQSASLSVNESASLPIAACTALQALRDAGGLRAGGSALIHGGAGGVGHFGVQIAKALGAMTTATCGPTNVSFVESLGADVVIDYSREDFCRRPERFDVVFDAVAMSSFPACGHLLKPGGTYVTTLPGPSIFFWGVAKRAASMIVRVKRARFVMVRQDGADLAFLGKLADSRQLRPTISETFALKDARQAHDASEEGHTRGKIVLEI
jgi:NADPH:quinone reductase-like Zn-dependent oxidoreductase